MDMLSNESRDVAAHVDRLDLLDLARTVGGYDEHTSPPTDWDEADFIMSPQQLRDFAVQVCEKLDAARAELAEREVPGSRAQLRAEIEEAALVGFNPRKTLERLLVVGAQIRIGESFAHSSSLESGSIITLVDGTFERENGLYEDTERAPSVWNDDSKEFDSIYHLFGNDLSDFDDCEVLVAPDAQLVLADTAGLSEDEIAAAFGRAIAGRRRAERHYVGEHQETPALDGQESVEFTDEELQAISFRFLPLAPWAAVVAFARAVIAAYEGRKGKQS